MPICQSKYFTKISNYALCIHRTWHSPSLSLWEKMASPNNFSEDAEFTYYGDKIRKINDNVEMILEAIQTI